MLKRTEGGHTRIISPSASFYNGEVSLKGTKIVFFIVEGLLTDGLIKKRCLSVWFINVFRKFYNFLTP